MAPGSGPDVDEARILPANSRNRPSVEGLRILKMLGASGASTSLAVTTQLLLPPAFLHFYGVARYGEWLVLTGTLSYLTTLNFGITTYASNELTMLRRRGELDAFGAVQSSSLGLLLGVTGLGLVLLSCIFVLPLDKLLHLTILGPADVTWTAFFLGLLTLVNIVAGYLNNLFMVVESAHRGTLWAAARAFGATLTCFVLTTLRTPFHVLALGQLISVTAIGLLSFWDLRRSFGGLPLEFKGANWKCARQMLGPSGMFGLIFAQQVLIFQVPVNLLQWIVGPTTVVLFCTCRTIFSGARQLLAPFTNAIAPEITFAFAKRDLNAMLSIFHQSERLVFAGIVMANLGAFLFAPLGLRIWLHRPQFFDLRLYGVMALITAAMSVRDHKQFFQLSTNMHGRLAGIVFVGNLVMIGCSVPLTLRFALYGFLGTWLVSEIVQAALIYFENRRLFLGDPSVGLAAVFKLAGLTTAGLLVCMKLVQIALLRSVEAEAVTAVVCEAVVIAAAWSVFGVKGVWRALRRIDPPVRVA